MCSIREPSRARRQSRAATFRRCDDLYRLPRKIFGYQAPLAARPLRTEIGSLFKPASNTLFRIGLVVIALLLIGRSPAR